MPKPDDWLNREETAQELTAWGFLISVRTLATLAWRIPGGPPFTRKKQRVYYRWCDATAWAAANDVPDRRDWRTREDIAAILTAAGFKTAPNSLAKYASDGIGPPYKVHKKRTYYEIHTALAWAAERQKKREQKKIAATE
jgi:hypothetical protein